MQSETSFVTPFGEQASDISQEQSAQRVIHSARSKPKLNPQERKLDVVSASVVIGGTAQFITFIFGLVTDFVPRLFDNVLLSALIGLCVGVIGYALMRGND